MDLSTFISPANKQHMLNGPTTIAVPIPIDPKLIDTSPPVPKSKDTPHRNSVTLRESQIGGKLRESGSRGNLKKEASAYKTLGRNITAPGGFGSSKKLNASNPNIVSSSDPSSKPAELSTKFYSDSINELREESTDVISIEELKGSFKGLAGGKEAKKAVTLKEVDHNPLKMRFLSFSKRLKGTVSGTASISDLVSLPKKTGLNDLKSKNNSTAKLNSFSNKGAAPSASAYDISQRPNDSLPKGLDDYYVIRRVGKGGFATVFLVRLKTSTGRYFALKVIKKSEVVRLKQERQIMNEKNILMELKHPLLVDLYSTFQSPSNLFMVMEFVAGGDLFTLLRKSKTKFYICEVLIVLEYLHSTKVVYRDLKPENILLDSTGHIKLADFGFAKRLSTTTSSFCGTPDYIAAEIVASKPYSFSVDWWSLGVLIFELISGKTPFRAEDSEGIYTNIQVGKVQWTPEVCGPIKEIVAGLLESDPKKRLGARGAEDIKKSTWFHGIQWEKVGHRGVNPPVVPAYATPETLEMEKMTKGVQSDYKDILGDALPNARFGDPYEGAFKGF